MQQMVSLVGLPDGARVLDLGGTPAMWESTGERFRITLVNLPGSCPPVDKYPNMSNIEHDACDLSGVFSDNSFDFVFSNSTIEHVGSEANQEKFAREARRLAPAYWVQTPSDRFPFEVHTWVPFYWSLPEKSRRALMKRWKRKLPMWSEMIEGTTVLSRQRMEHLFPGAKCYIERLMGLEKSYSFYVPIKSPA
jgi:hypothetical protein